MEMYGSYRGLIPLPLFMFATLANATVDCAPPPPTTPQELGVEPIAAATIPYPAIDPQQVVDVFMAAVGRGELVVFGVPLAGNALDPRQVEYVYTLQTRLPTVRVHAALIQSFPIPGAPNVRATAVTGVLDWAGRIIDSIVHCE
jgi:hypothetical protein